MSDYGGGNFDFRDPDNQFRRSPGATWGWIAAAVFLVIVLAVAFGIGRQPGQSDNDDVAFHTAPPAASRMTPPPAAASTATPAPGPTTMPPIAPASSPPEQ